MNHFGYKRKISPSCLAVAFLVLPFFAGCTSGTAGETRQFPQIVDVVSEKAEMNYAVFLLENGMLNENTPQVLEACDLILHLTQFSRASVKADDSQLADAGVWLSLHEQEEKAEEILGKAIKVFPHSFPITLGKGRLLLLKKKDKEACALLDDFVKKHPADLEARAEYAFFLLQVGNAKDAEKNFAKIPSEKLTREQRIAYAKALQLLGRHQEALTHFSFLLKDDPEDEEILYFTAILYEDMKKPDNARKILKKLKENNPKNYNIDLLLLHNFLCSGKMKDSVRMVKENPEQRRLIADLFSLLTFEKKSDLLLHFLQELEKIPGITPEVFISHAQLLTDAERDLEHALALANVVPSDDPSFRRALLLKIRIRYSLNKEKEALPDSLLLARLAKDKELPQMIAIELCMHLKEYEKARELINGALELFPDSEELALKDAFLCGQMKDTKKAMEKMEKLLLKAPDNATALNYVGYSLADEGKDLNRAYDLLVKADRLMPNEDFILDSLAWVCYKKGDVNKAWTYIQRAFELHQKKTGNEKSKLSFIGMDPVLLEHYADIADTLGKKQSAKTFWTHAEKEFDRTGQKEDSLRVRRKLESAR